jgi:homoserine dehydrogenase
VEDIRSEYYLRVMALDRPGVLAQVAGILGANNISLASVLQKTRAVSEAVPVVMMTHEARERDMRAALAAIDRLSVVALPTTMIRVESA